MFIHAKLRGMKHGNLVTLLKDMGTDKIPMDLWKYESFPYEDYKTKILSYVETEASKARKEEMLRKQNEDHEKELELEKEREAKKKEIKLQIENTTEAYRQSFASSEEYLDKIYALLEELNISEKECPICNAKLSLKASVCHICGWPMAALEGIEEFGYLNMDNKNSTAVYKDIYNEYLRLKNHPNTEDVANSHSDESENSYPTESKIVPIKKISLSKEKDKELSADILTVSMGDKKIELQKVQSSQGDFFITKEEIPSDICRKLGARIRFPFNKIAVEDLPKMLENLDAETGYFWDFPTLDEWITAYNSKVFTKKDYYPEWCVDDEGKWVSIYKPSEYRNYDPSGVYHFRLVIRTKDNPQLNVVENH